MYEVNFGSYGHRVSRGGRLDLLYDVLGRAVEIGSLDHFAATFRMYQYFYAWILGSRFGDLLYVETHMRSAVTFPEDNAGTLDLLVGIIRGHRVFRVPDYHLLLRYAELERGVTAQVLVGEEEYALATTERPLDHGGGSRGGTNEAAIAPTKSLEGCPRDHFSDRD